MTPLRAVIVDDQPAIRQALQSLLDGQTDIQVIGTACDGEEGLKLVFSTQPDVILLDLEMPRMDGFAFLRLLMTKRPTPVIVVSSHSARESVFKALELGALEFVAKPTHHMDVQDLQIIRGDLLSKIRLARRLKAVTLSDRAQAHVQHIASTLTSREAPAPAEELGARAMERLLCIGASTGGPTSIMTLLLRLPEDLPVGVLITQHMPERFTAAFADRLRRTTRWSVKEAEPEDVVSAGRVLVASGSWSLRVAAREGTLRVLPPLIGESRGHGFVPSVDRMLEAAAEAMGRQVVAVILTGMSGDGTSGALSVKQHGGRVLVEAPESAIVSSMPQEVIRSGAADEVVPLAEMVEAIRRAVPRG